MLQLLIGYICGSMATDKRLNCNLLFEKRKDGTYKIHFVPKNDREQAIESAALHEDGVSEETHEELVVRGISFDN